MEPQAGTRGAGGGGGRSVCSSRGRCGRPAGAGTKLPCAQDSALRRAAFCGNLTALPSHLVPSGRSVRVFISANPEGTGAERLALRENVYPKLRELCRKNYVLEFQVIDLYWGIGEDEWDSPELQKTRMKLLEDYLKTSAGPCFVACTGDHGVYP